MHYMCTRKRRTQTMLLIHLYVYNIVILLLIGAKKQIFWCIQLFIIQCSTGILLFSCIGLLCFFVCPIWHSLITLSILGILTYILSITLRLQGQIKSKQNWLHKVTEQSHANIQSVSNMIYQNNKTFLNIRKYKFKSSY